jgi:DNA modification methylase
MSKFNDLDISNWKDYLGDITTDALWVSGIKKNDGKFVIPKRDFLPPNNPEFHGLFIPEIPYQFIKRFTKENETVWDCFGGSGTTYRVAEILNRKCIINDLTPKEDYIQQGDSTIFNPNQQVQLIIMHPPYHNIVKYNDDERCGSSKKTIDDFVKWFDLVADNVTQYLEKERFLILVCGNLYTGGEEHTLGVTLKNVIRSKGFKLKSHIIKDYGETKGSGGKDYNLNYYRGLKNNYNSFYGDNIFILQKK